MPPKRGQKRKATKQTTSTDVSTNGDADLLPPDRATWPGWVEMESEPAFFNVMLKEMGVRGVRVQEVYGLDDEMLAILPHAEQPVHGLIFLFRYREAFQAQQEKGTECPKHVWFANQIPDFACASVALLNIVNNIKGLHLGKELRDFKDFTHDMDPISRGDAIDSFEFVKHIHNSFASENDLLNADLHLRQKANRAKKKAAVAKARATKEANKTGNTPLKEKSLNVPTTPTRVSARQSRPAIKQSTKDKSSNGNFLHSPPSSPLSDPPDSDPEFETPSKPKAKAKTNGQAQPPRRSERKPQPRKDVSSAKTVADADDEDGFHFIAYMPIQGHVWKLDGLDSFPHDMGAFDSADGGDWMKIAQPALQTHMAVYEGSDIEFNLMAVVHDPVMKDRAELLQNIKEIQAFDKKLDSVLEDWRSLEGAETRKDSIFAASTNYDISEADIQDTELEAATSETVEKEDDPVKLIDLRKQVLSRQAPLKASVRDSMQSAKEDEEKAKHRRHDYGKFVRGWLEALADQEALPGLLDET